MADAVDSGVSRDWPAVTRYAWLVVMLAFLFFGFGSLVQVVVPPLLGRSDVKWFPETPARTPIRKVLIVGATVLLLVWATSIFWRELTGRAAIAGMGLFVIYLAASRTPGLWEEPRVATFREIFGDRAIQVIYLSIGLGLIALAVFNRL